MDSRQPGYFPLPSGDYGGSRVRLTRITGSIVLLWILVSLGGCGEHYRPGVTPARILLQHKSSTYDQFPVTLPVKLGQNMTLRARLEPPLSPRFRLQSSDWKWTEHGDSDVLSTGKVLDYNVSDTARGLQLTSTLRWKISRETAARYIVQTLRSKIYLAPGIHRQTSQTEIRDYRIGTFPETRDQFAWYRNHYVVMEPSPYYATPGASSPRGSLNKGQKLYPTERGRSQVQGRLEVRMEHRRIWIPPRAITLPPSIRYHPRRYQPPDTYYPVTKRNGRGFILPYLRWRELDHDVYYRDHLSPPYPHYIPVRRVLLEKLRGLQQQLRKHGHPRRIKLVSGVRNPYYNQREFDRDQTLKALFSRHQYGDAVDLIVDGSMDGRMDDLNRDGRVDIGDAQRVADLMDSWNRSHDQPGGIGVYGFNDVKTRKQTPYVHIDARGFRARWTVR